MIVLHSESSEGSDREKISQKLQLLNDSLQAHCNHANVFWPMENERSKRGP